MEGMSQRRSAAGGDKWQRDRRVGGNALRRRTGGDGQEGDFGGGVETQPKQETDQVHLPAVGDQLEEPAEETRQQAAGEQLMFERIAVVLAGPHPPEQSNEV